MENSENSRSAKLLQHAHNICICILRSLHVVWGKFFNWTLETASGNDMDNIKCSPGYTGQHNTRQSRAGQSKLARVSLAQLCLRFGPFLVPLQRVQCKYKSTNCWQIRWGFGAWQTRQLKQPQMHQLSNCLPRQRRHNVHQIIARAVTRPDQTRRDNRQLDTVLETRSLSAPWSGVVWARWGTRGIGKFDLWLIMCLMSFHNLIIPGHARDRHSQ